MNNNSFPNLELLVLQAITDRMKRIILDPFIKICKALNAIYKTFKGCSYEIENFLMKKTIYDWEYQYNKSLQGHQNTDENL